MLWLKCVEAKEIETSREKVLSAWMALRLDGGGGLEHPQVL